MNESFGKHSIPDLPLHDDRKALVVERCRGKKVLHVGCADAPYTADRLASGDLLHARIGQVAADLWGLDSDAHALALLRDVGYEQLVVADLCANLGGASSVGDTGQGRVSQAGDSATVSGWGSGGDLRRGLASLSDGSFDLIVATEVIEHLLCPGRALRNLASLMRPGRTQLLVTVPNAYRIDTILGLFQDREFVHPDHNAWYSWYTATNLLKKAGFSVVESGFYSHHRPGLMPSSLAAFGGGVWSRVKAAALGAAASILGKEGGAGPVGMGSRKAFIEEEGGAGKGPAGQEASSVDWIERMRGYLSGLPPRIAVTLLAGKPALWADGIYLVAEVPA